MLFQPLCLLCQQSARRRLCNDCEQSLASLTLGLRQCQQCALPLANDEPFCGECLSRPPAFEQACIAYRYEFPLDYLIGRYKFSGCLAAEQLLCELFQGHIAANATRPDLIIPTPLHWRRQFSRGYNQSLRLAQAVAASLNIPLGTQYLVKHRATTNQHDLSKRERKANLLGSFSCRPLCGQTVALVDDVVTTATTARILSQQLLRAGAGSVHLWALARTPASRTSGYFWTETTPGNVQ